MSKLTMSRKVDVLKKTKSKQSKPLKIKKTNTLKTQPKKSLKSKKSLKPKKSVKPKKSKLMKAGGYGFPLEYFGGNVDLKTWSAGGNNTTSVLPEGYFGNSLHQ